MILLVGPSPQRPGGIATWVRLVGEALAKQRPDLDWELFPTDKPSNGRGPLLRRVDEGLAAASRFRRRIAQDPPELVHLLSGSGWGFREVAVFSYLARRQGCPVVLHFQAARFEEYWQKHPLEAPFIRRTLRSACAVATLSPAFTEFYANLGAPKDRLCVIPNVALSRPFESAPMKIPSENDPLRLLAVGSLEVRKGYGELIEAAEELRRKRGPVVEIRCLGPSHVSEDQRTDWAQRGQRCGVEFAGAVPPSTVIDHLQSCDGFVLPTHAEGLPFAVVEAMAAGRPVISTRVGAIPELLADGAGDLIEPRDVPALVAAIERWLDDPERRTRLARRGWERAQNHYSVDAALTATVACWDRVLGDAGQMERRA